jgi:hypothetical protein
VSARKPSPGPPPDCAWGVAAPSQIAGSWVPPRPCLVLRQRCPLSRPVGREAWPSGVSVLYGHTLCSRLALHDRARCPLLCPSVSPSNRPSTASPRVPEGCNRSMATVADVCTSLLSGLSGSGQSQTFAPVFAALASSSSWRACGRPARPRLPRGCSRAWWWYPVVQGGRQGGRAQSVEKAV